MYCDNYRLLTFSAYDNTVSKENYENQESNNKDVKHISEGLEIPIKYILQLTNGKNMEFDSVDTWAVEYDKVLRAIFDYDKMEHAERRTKMKDLENLNEEFIDDILPDYLRQTIKEQRIKFNKILSVDAREQENELG